MFSWFTRDQDTYTIKLCGAALLVVLVAIVIERGRQPMLTDEFVARAEVVNVTSRGTVRGDPDRPIHTSGRVRLPDGLEATVSFGYLTPVQGEYLPVRVRAYSNGQRRVLFTRR